MPPSGKREKGLQRRKKYDTMIPYRTERTEHMDKSFLLEAIDPLPMLLWDTGFPTEELTENRPYRNIGEMLVKRSPTNREALRLCGCDPAILNGETSDYECFAALCMATPLLLGHRAAMATETILKMVFGWETPLSPYQIEELWTVLNEIIEDRALRPSDVAEALNIESLCYRWDPRSPLPDPTFGKVDLYPIFNLSDPLATLATIPQFDGGLADVIQVLTDRLTAFLEAGCVAVRIILPKTYRFFRNSRKKEVDDLLHRLMGGEHLSTEEENQILTALLIALSYHIPENRLTLLLETEAEEDELIRLYDYLALNETILETLLITAHPKEYKTFFGRHTHRTEKGLPSLLPVSEDFATLTMHFPVGTAILPYGPVSDAVSLAEGYRQRDLLVKTLMKLDAAPEALTSLAEDLVYGNIKNRFGI